MKKRSFDIRSPKGATRQKRQSASGSFLVFFMLGFGVFSVLGGLALYHRGSEFLADNRSVALEGYGALERAAHSLGKRDTDGASFFLEDAKQAFDELARGTQHLTAQAGAVSGESPYLGSVEKLMEGALGITELGQEAIGLLEEMRAWPAQVMEAQGQGGEAFAQGMMGLLHEKHAAVKSLLERGVRLQNLFTTLGLGAVPQDIREKLGAGQEQMADLVLALKRVDEGFDTVFELLGDRSPHNYLILLQNSTERRATGGFIGSYILLTLNDGAIQKLEAHDVYEADGQMNGKVPAPPGIDQVADGWYMRDSNYSPDFPTAAKQVMWFLEHSRQPSVDTVIAIDQTVVEELLRLTGPVFVDGIPFEISADSFMTIIPYYVEAKLGDGGTSKRLMFEMLPLLRKGLASADPNALVAMLVRMVDHGHIQAYSSDFSVQSLVTSLNIDGSMPKAPKETDFLSVISTSIGGNKSDAYIQTDMAHRSEVMVDGGVTDHLYIQKTHLWQEGEFERRFGRIAGYYGGEKLSAEALSFILGEGESRDYMRVYVPHGARLKGAEGINLADVSVTQDLGYTVLSFNFPPVPAGHSRAVTLHYDLPHELGFVKANRDDDLSVSHYRFIANAQAAAERVSLKKSLVLADGLILGRVYPQSEGGEAILEGPLEGNSIFIAEILGR